MFLIPDELLQQHYDYLHATITADHGRKKLSIKHNAVHKVDELESRW